MMAEIKLKKELLERLQIRSKQTGIATNVLVEQYVEDGLNNGMTEEEIKSLLDYDLPEGDQASEKLCDLIDNSVQTNSVQLKKQSYIRGR